jgi:hypothetical protein
LNIGTVAPGVIAAFGDVKLIKIAALSAPLLVMFKPDYEGDYRVAIVTVERGAIRVKSTVGIGGRSETAPRRRDCQQSAHVAFPSRVDAPPKNGLKVDS